MKRFISILLVAVMLVAMIPAGIFTASAAETTLPTQTWIEAGKYDLSWAADLITTTETSGQSVTVDGNIYTCKYINKTYTLDTVEKLVGLAVLANAGAIETFSGTTFKLTAAEYDLSSYLWTPIGYSWSQKFRGSLVSDNGTVIKGMTIVSTDTATNKCWGLIGMHGNGNIKNITLENAYIDVACGQVGSFVAYENSCGTATYENLKSDATIISKMPSTNGVYTTHGNGWIAAGGILGVHNNSAAANVLTMKNCVFTGTIDAPSVCALGGMVGLDRSAATVNMTGCVVASDYFRYGAYRHGGVDADWTGMGGILGLTWGGTWNIDQCYVAIDEFTVYKEQQDTNGNGGRSVGGMVGLNSNTATVNFTNCQVDMLSSGGANSHHHGTFVGEELLAVTFNNCVSTGGFLRLKDQGWYGVNSVSWSARALTTGGENNFASFPQRYGWNITASTPTVIESVNTWKTTLDSTKWSERDGSIYPILTVAKNYASHSVSGANTDYSFFTLGSALNVATVAELNALNNIFDMYSVSAHEDDLFTKVTLDEALKTINLYDYDYAFRVAVGAKLGVEVPADPEGSWADNYDLSWAEGLITDTATDGQSCTVDGKIYTIKYHVATYEIDTPAKLAGVAVLANAANIESFSGTTFKITTDLDLGAHYWEPIANNTAKKFRGLITADSEAVIKNMTIIDTANDANKCYGLVGAQGGGQQNTGAISNITLKNASINVKNGYVGSFVGYLNHGGVEYKNIKSDAKIVYSSGIDGATGEYVEHNNAYAYVGGIVGRVVGSAAETLTGCVFTGSIDAPTASCVGGIVAGDRRADGMKLTFNKCVVSADYIRYGAYRPGGYNAWYGGCAGIVGIALYVDVALNECYVALGEYTFYAEQNAPTYAHEGMGGMVGNTDASGTLAFTNCQMDIAVGNSNTASHLATFVGRHFAPATFTGCVNTGIVARIKGAGWNGANTFAWSARNPGITDGGNNFASFAQRYGWDVTTSTPTVIESVDTWNTALDSTVWSERDGSIYPILAVAKDYTEYSVSGAGVDYSFFNVAGCKVTTSAELKALGYIADAMVNYADDMLAVSGGNADRVRIAPKLAAADLSGFKVATRDLIKAELYIDANAVIDTEGETFNMGKSFIQTKTDGTAVRFAILMNKADVTGVTFEVALTRGTAFGDGFLESGEIKTAYKKVVYVPTETEYVAAEFGGSEDWVYVVFVVNRPDITAGDVFTVRANATTSNGVVQSVANNYTIQ